MSRVAASPRPAQSRRYGVSRYLVPHESSLWFARTIAIGGVATGAVLGLASWLYHQEILEAFLGNGYVLSPELLERYQRVSLTTALNMAATTAIFMVAIAGFLMHRIAGPIYRLHEHLLSVLNGESVEELHFRDGDRLAEIRDAYNQLLYKVDILGSKPDEAPPA